MIKIRDSELGCVEFCITTVKFQITIAEFRITSMEFHVTLWDSRSLRHNIMSLLQNATYFAEFCVSSAKFHVNLQNFVSKLEFLCLKRN